MPNVQTAASERSNTPRAGTTAFRHTLKSALRWAASVLALTCLFNAQAAPLAVQPDGTLQLDASAATIHGQTARFMVLDGLGNICYWTDPADWLSWRTSFGQAGEFVVELKFSCAAGSQGSTFDVTLGDTTLSGRIAADTGTWYDHEIMKLGSLKVSQAGPQTLALKPTRKPGQAVMNLAWLRLIPSRQYRDYLTKTAAEHQASATILARAVFVVPNFHPASCGWLTDWSTERNYCAYSYLTHLDRVRDDSHYAFALSEVNNMMAILEFEPQRFEELKQRIREGRVELCNSFFLEPTINLSGGEALVKMGVEGLRWQQRVMGARPRLYWGIDVTGVHEQMAQIVAGLGLDGFVYCRDNPTGSTLHWQESPDGTRALALSPGHYSDFDPLFATKEPLSQAQLRELAANLRNKARHTPAPAPLLVLGGSGDYALAPARKEYPAEFLQQWKEFAPAAPLQFTGPGRYLDAVLPLIQSGQVQLPVSRSGAHLTWSSFWIQCPTVKQRYRESEQALQAAEAVSVIASLKSSFAYPVQPLNDAWLLMCLNMDRNTLWGAAGGMVFESSTSWDVRDRFDKVDSIAAQHSSSALHSLLGGGPALGIFNPLNWRRHDPVRVRLTANSSPAGVPCQADAEGLTLCEFDVLPLSATGAALTARPPDAPKPIDLPPTIETKHYRARIDPASGALVSLKLKPSGREILSGPILLVAEQGGDGHNTPRRPQRQRLADSAQFKPALRVTRGSLATVVEARSKFHGGGELRQTLHFYADSPRIDFDVECEDIPNQNVVVAEFPLAREIKATRRGIPYGFSHGAWSVPNTNLFGFTDGILAAIRWSHYEFVDGAGVALLDRGLPGRELTGRTPVLFLLNAQDTYLGYRCAWLSGKGRHHASFALVAHDCDWPQSRIPQMAWEFNCPPVLVPGVQPAAPASFAQTSDNVIVQAVRREGAFIELRLAECFGVAGKASVTLSLPHTQAALTDLVGQRATPLPGGPKYEFPVRPQQIVTLRFKTAQPVADIEPRLKWDDLVPEAKLPALKKKLPGRVGHPPEGTEGQ
jgi:alpha-mannosidase